MSNLIQYIIQDDPKTKKKDIIKKKKTSGIGIMNLLRTKRKKAIILAAIICWRIVKALLIKAHQIRYQLLRINRKQAIVNRHQIWLQIPVRQTPLFYLNIKS